MPQSVWDRIEEARARHDVLQHPFYVRWSAGELTSEELARYSGQYRHAVTAIAELSSQAASELPDHPELASHAGEEYAHVALWDGRTLDGRTDPAPGVYYVQLTVDGVRYTRKMIVRRPE